MNPYKQKLLDSLKERISKVQERILKEKEKIKELSSKSIREVKSLFVEDQATYMRLKAHASERTAELDHLYASPFFVKLDIENAKTKEKKELYFAKHHLTEENIYSWIAPVSSIRFEKPGPVRYKLPDGTFENAILNQKEQYMIVNGKVVFFAIESTTNPRELIYQEHFSAKKDGFVLPEIVAVMEKAQDTVIRAHHVVPFVISGPAGSGKTTLALHRVAFLVQSPDTAHLYPGESIVVFVQDNGTKEYFSHLLPELGINNVHITTFFEWATTILGIPESVSIRRRGNDEQDRNQKEFERLDFLSTKQIPSWNETKKFLAKHSKTGIDRLDLTLALASYRKHHKKFEMKTKYRTTDKNGEIVTKTRKLDLTYSLIVIDEFQNYTPDQLLLLNLCADEKTKSVIYVGDIAQQVVSGSLRSWKDISLEIDKEREVKLHKVYRNTRQILEYIGNLGYKVEIPEGIKNGNQVKEVLINSEKEIITYLENLAKNIQGSLGIIGKDEEGITYLKNRFKDRKNIYTKTMAESQGVEFDTVCLVGIKEDFFSTTNFSEFPAEFIEEKKKIQKDLLYVALTRAISELHVVGPVKLSTLPSSQTQERMQERGKA